MKPIESNIRVFVKDSIYSNVVNSIRALYTYEIYSDTYEIYSDKIWLGIQGGIIHQLRNLVVNNIIQHLEI